MPERPPTEFHFGAYRLDTAQRALFRGAERVRLTPKAYDTLVVMVRRNGETIGKDELIRAVWPDVFVDENNLNQHVSLLRKRLGPRPGGGHYIETDRGYGYRFTGVLSDGPADGPAAPQAPGRRRPATLITAVTVGMLAVAGLVVARGALGGSDVRSARGSSSPSVSAAEAAYLAGRAFLNQRTSEGLHRAALEFEQAIAADEEYAPAHAALATTYAFDTRLWPDAEPAARRALQLDAENAEAHAVIGFVRMFWEWRWSDAERRLRRAVTARSPSASAHQWYAAFLLATARPLEARAELTRALDLDPLSPSIHADFARFHYSLGEHDEALTRARHALTLDPDFMPSRLLLYEIQTERGAYDEALEMFFDISRRLAGHPLYNRSKEPSLRAAYAASGVGGFWRALRELAADEGLSYSEAEYAARLGHVEPALRALWAAVDARHFDLAMLRATPAFRGLHGDPGMDAVLASVGLPPLERARRQKVSSGAMIE